MNQKSRRIILYSHDAMGIGHVRRNLRIAQALRAADSQSSVLLISGVAEGTWFPLPRGVDFLALPSLRKELSGRYTPRRLEILPDELVDLRARVIATTVRSFQPDLLIVDKQPCGVSGELVPALLALRATPNARCVLGLRDILDDAAVVRREWQSNCYDQWISRYYDAIWIYGDPAVYDTAGQYAFSPQLQDITHYTGYLDRIVSPTVTVEAGDPASADGRELLLCMCGGGEDAGPLARAFAQAPFAANQRGLILAGPFMPPADRQAVREVAARRGDLDVVDFTPDPIKYLVQASRVVLMGGYNSVCEVLSTPVPALVVPRVSPRSEQLVRAEILAERRMIDLLHPDAATPQAIGAWLAQPHLPVTHRGTIDFGGLDRLPGLLDQLVRRPATLEATVQPRRRATHAIG